MWSKVAVQPSPVGDWARKPTRTSSAGSPPSAKYRSKRHQDPSV